MSPIVIRVQMLEKLKRQLTRPDQSIEISDDSPIDPTNQVGFLNDTLSSVLAVLLDQEDGLSIGSTATSAGIESTQLKSCNPCEIGLALEIINLTFRKLKTFRLQSHQDKYDRHTTYTLSSQVLSDIARAIWIHWNLAIPGISFKLKTTLKNLLDHIIHLQVSLSQCSAIQFFFEAIRKSVLIEKRSLSILSHLVPLLPLSDTLDGLKVYVTHPSEFLRVLLNAIGDDKLASLLGQVALHWTTKIEGWLYRSVKPIDSSTIYHSDWIPITLSILFSSEERKRQYLSQYYILPLLKTRSQCFNDLTEAIPSYHQPQSTNDTNSSDSYLEYLSGLIALARLDPCQSSTQIQSSNKGRILSEPWLPDKLLKMCISHPAVSLRSSVFAILCQSNSPTSHLSAHYLDLVLYFFTYNFGLVEPDLKQNVSSNLNVLFSRLRDSTNSSKKKLVDLMKRKLTQFQQLKEATDEFENQISHHNSYLETVKSFITNFLKLCRTNLTFSAPYRCQIASLNYILILLNTGIDPLYISSEPSTKHALQKQVWFAFNIKITDQSLTNSLILALSSTYVNVRDSAFTILTNCSTLDSQFQKDSKSKQLVLSYAIQCLNSKRESENSTASLLFRLILVKSVMNNYQLSQSLLSTQNSDRGVVPTNPLAAFLWDRLDDLEERTIAAERNLGKACEDRPIQGSIMVISELFKSLSKDMIVSLVASNDLLKILKYTKKLISRISRLSTTVLCYSSDQQNDAILEHEEARVNELISAQNEGDSLDNEHLFQLRSYPTPIGHQSILSVCWRSMKEVSALLTKTVKLSLVAQELSGNGDSSVTFLSYQDLFEVGEIFEQWLLEIRHRGAFGAIHSAYSSLCESLCALPQDSASSKLPVLWLQAHISAITSRKISTTRRSAGLPYCILSVCQALSSSDPNKMRDSLNSILNLVKSKEISLEAKVHIFNTLKILLTDGKVSTQISSSLIEMGYDLAIKSFVSADWKVRNGALILFSGLTNRVFGTRSLTLDRSHVNLCKRETLSDLFRRLPMMCSILLNELSRSMQAGVNELSSNASQGPIFSVLSLLALVQNPDGAPAANEFIKFTVPCLQSKVSKIRSISADAMTGLIPCREVPSWICNILMKISSSNCYNEVHGSLLLINRLLEVPSSLLPEEKIKIQATVASSAPKFLSSSKAPLICQSLFLEILQCLESRFGIRLNSDDTLNSDLLTQKIKKLHVLRVPGFNSYETQVTRRLLRQPKEKPQIVLNLLKEGSTAARLEVSKFLEKIENRIILNRPEIGNLILSFASQPIHQIPIRRSALQLLEIGSASSTLNMNRWPLEELFKDYESCQVVPIRNALIALSPIILFNSVDLTQNNDSNQTSLEDWAIKIIDKIEEAAQENQSTETRIFALRGLKEFLKHYKMNLLSDEIKLKVLEILINLIQDDDDEIRTNLIKTLHQTQFFLQNEDEDVMMEKKYNEEEKSKGKLGRVETIELELVPVIILEKLILISVQLDPLFGFKKLLKTDDVQSDLDQVMNLSSTDLFVAERLNLHKDDGLEFNLIQESSLNLFKILDEEKRKEGLAVQVEGVETEEMKDNKKILKDLSFDSLKEEIETFKTLTRVLIPPSSSLMKEIAEDEIGSLFKKVYIKSNKEGEDFKIVTGDELGMMSYISWFKLMTRLFHVMKIIKKFPTNLKSSFFVSLQNDKSLIQDENISRFVFEFETQMDVQFDFVQNIVNFVPSVVVC